MKIRVCLGEFQLRVPVVVLGELEGLGKGRHLPDRPEHAAITREKSRSALDWIKEKPANLKCVTTKGNPTYRHDIFKLGTRYLIVNTNCSFL